MCQGGSLSVLYLEGDAAELMRSYTARIEALGWTERVASDTGTVFDAIYGKDGDTLSIQVGPEEFAGDTPGAIRVGIGITRAAAPD